MFCGDIFTFSFGFNLKKDPIACNGKLFTLALAFKEPFNHRKEL